MSKQSHEAHVSTHGGMTGIPGLPLNSLPQLSSLPPALLTALSLLPRSLARSLLTAESSRLIPALMK
jgi:hypothetical protein